MYPTKIAPSTPPNHKYHGPVAVGLNCITADGFVARFNANKQIMPIVKLINDPISGPPICLPNLVFKTACVGIMAPINIVRNISTYFIRTFLLF